MRVLATIHGADFEDVNQRSIYGIFERYVCLGGWQQAGRVRQILDQKGKILFKAV